MYILDINLTTREVTALPVAIQYLATCEDTLGADLRAPVFEAKVTGTRIGADEVPEEVRLEMEAYRATVWDLNSPYYGKKGEYRVWGDNNQRMVYGHSHVRSVPEHCVCWE
jgi:hypothetical protein